MGSLCRQLIRRMRLQGVATLAGKRGVVQPQDLLGSKARADIDDAGWVGDAEE